jgi:hypothetical protein
VEKAEATSALARAEAIPVLPSGGVSYGALVTVGLVSLAVGVGAGAYFAARALR